jgi:hypothetical protein
MAMGAVVTVLCKTLTVVSIVNIRIAALWDAAPYGLQHSYVGFEGMFSYPEDALLKCCEDICT